MSIEFKNLTFVYDGMEKAAISGLSVRFCAEKITLLTGVSGCGKSTLLYLAAGLYPKSAGKLLEGEVLAEGVHPGELPPPERCRLTGMMFQNPELQFCMDTPEHELQFCLENIALPPEAMPARIDEAFDFCEIAPLRARKLITLSGGERQKVMLACLYALRPRWLLLDEPFANIDDASARAIAGKLKEIHLRFGTGILAVDHRLDNWLDAADEIRFMADGKISEELMSAAAPDEAALKSRGIIVPNRSYLDVRPSRRKPGRPLITIENLSVSPGGESVLRGASAAFDAGRMHAIVGQSGCGKSTLFGAMSGLYRYRGRILLEGQPIQKCATGTLGFVTQNPQDQFVAGTVLGEILASLRGVPGEQARARAEQILRGIRLWRYRDVSPYLLSQGQQRRLGVAALMAYPCRALICDEPTYAQDGISTLSIMEELRRRVDEDGLCLIFSTHDKMLARDYADQIWRLEGGLLHAIPESGL